MSTAAPAQHCSSCGLPVASARCAVCGGSAHALTLLDGDAASSSAYASTTTRPELDLANEAWRAGDHARTIAHCLTTIGARDPKPETTPDGPLFKVALDEQSLFVRVRSATGLLVIEVPVARFPRTQYVPALRLALELSDRDSERSRFSARGDLVLCRTVMRLAALSPVVLCDAMRSTLSSAIEAARVFIGALQARPLTPRDHRGFSVDSLPTGLDLEAGVGTPSRVAQAAQASPALHDDFDEPPSEAGIPAALMPPSRSLPPAQREHPTVNALRRPVLPDPGLVTQTSAVAPSAAARAPTSAPQAPASAPATLPAAHDPNRVAAAQAPSTSKSPAMVDPLGDTFVGELGGRATRTGGPEDALCGLLHQAQALGAALSFADLPATMLLLVRAAVYQAVYEHGGTFPSAVAYLHDEVAPLTREIHITAPGKRRGAMAIPSAAPAFEVMNRLVSSRCDVGAERALQVQPITTSQDAKQHLARYVSEIGVAPDDLELRHFLALGALSELLVRTKLPAPTQEKLRGLIGRARSEGPKQPVVDLMLTALSRMMA